jgi:hypothetical protein
MTGHLVAAEVAHRSLTTLDVVGSMHERKARMAALSDGVVVLPGGFGTLDEAFETLTWNQLGLLSVPVVFLDPVGYFDNCSSSSTAGCPPVSSRSPTRRRCSARRPCPRRCRSPPLDRLRRHRSGSDARGAGSEG